MNRAYSLLEIKSVDEESRKFSGIASTPSTDRVGDIVEPDGAEFKLPLPLLWQHDSRDPIGWIKKAKVNSKGIEVEGEVAKINEPGQLQGRLTRAWQMIKSGLVRGLSIGFKDLESAEIKGTWGTRFIKWEWLELSAVTIPANVEATITAIKSIDKGFLAALGHKPNGPGASGKTKEKGMKTLQEQLAELKEARKTKAARMNELAEIVKAESRDWSETESTEFETLETELRQLDGDIRMKTVECMNASTAKEVDSTPSKHGPVFWKQPEDQKEKFQGQNFTRKAIAKALGYLEGLPAYMIAERRWGKTNPKLVEIMKADMQGAASGTSHWMSDLVITDGRYTGDFIEYLKSKSIFDRLPLKEVPANVTIKGQDGAATGYWIAEGTAIKMSELTTTSVALTPYKVAALTVMTNELLRDSSPAAEMIVRDALVYASNQIVDTTFLGAAAGGTGYPAGMLNSVVAVSTNGTDGTALRSDVRDLYAAFITAKNASGLYFVMNPALAKAIQLLSNTLGIQEFPTINQDGGTLLGDPVVTGDNVGSNDLILLKPSDIWRIGDTGIEVSVSREASIEMADNPGQEVNTPTAATQKVVNMFQTESTAIKVVRAVNFKKRRSTAVQFITDASYGTAAS